MIQYSKVLLGAAVVLALAGIGRADVTENFDNTGAGKNGWTTVGDPDTTLTYVSTGGNPNGYISLYDAAEGNNDYFSAPAAFLGDKSLSYGLSLTFDLRTQFAAAPYIDVALTGNGHELDYVFPTQPPGGASFITYDLTLSPSDLNWHYDGLSGAEPTIAQFQDVLADLSSMKILGDFIGGNETNDLDNVTLEVAPASVPEPASLGLLSLGVVALLRRRNRVC